jgi:hypothetical protein
MDMFRRIGSVVCAAALLCAGAASAATIDSFDTSQFIGSRLIPGQELSIAIADEALGGEREAQLNSLHIGAIESKVEAGDLILKILRLVDSPPFMQNITSLTYDGVDNSFGWNLSNAFDLTDGGISDRFIVEGFVDSAVLALDPSVPLNATMYLHASAYGGYAPQDRFTTRLEIDLPITDLSTPAVPVHYEILFSQLVPADGFDPVDLSSATAVAFTFNTTATNLLLRIDTICTGNSDGCAVQIADLDQDGIPDSEDNCQSVPNPDQTDTDLDGVGDACDPCPLDLTNDSDGDGSCDSEDLCIGNDNTGDFDTDGLCDDSDPCIGFSNTDLDNDGFCDDGDLCYGDDASGNSDGDGVCDDLDQCLGDDATGDTDGDLFCDDIDACLLDIENDGDADGICETDDNCDLVYNPDQADLDTDGIGDVCDSDRDNDGFDNDVDNCPLHPNADQADFDGDGEGDACDQDNDADGVLDSLDACLATPLGSIVNGDGCSIGDLCPCDNNWKNHGAYVKCVAHTSEDFLAAGLINALEKDTIVSTAAQSSCGN